MIQQIWNKLCSNVLFFTLRTNIWILISDVKWFSCVLVTVGSGFTIYIFAICLFVYPLNFLAHFRLSLCEKNMFSFFCHFPLFSLSTSLYIVFSVNQYKHAPRDVHPLTVAVRVPVCVCCCSALLGHRENRQMLDWKASDDVSVSDSVSAAAAAAALFCATSCVKVLVASLYAPLRANEVSHCTAVTTPRRRLNFS